MQSSPKALKLAYRKHRQRVQQMKSQIDHKSPIVHAGNYLRIAKYKEDAETFMAMDKMNGKLLRNITGILQTHGAVDNINTMKTLRSPNISNRMKRVRSLQLRNLKFGNRLLCVKGDLAALRKQYKKDVKNKSSKQELFIMPKQILSKYEKFLTLPQNEQLLRKLLRPKLHFNLEVCDVRSLGVITIQLYTEASPQVVLEFVRLCTMQNNKSIKFVRNFPALWIEAELQLPENSWARKHIEYDMRALQHDAGSGVLSYSCDYLKGFCRGAINFTISYKPLRVLNGRRVAFGIVTSGRKILDYLQEYGTKNGKPTKQIIITVCGAKR